MKKIFIYSFLALFPTVSFAALDGVRGLLMGAQGVLNLLVPVMFGIAVIYFFWGMGQFVLHDAGNDKTRADGKQKMLWGLIALFVMVALYGILKFVGNAIGIPVNTGSTNTGLEQGGCAEYENTDLGC